MPNYSYRCDACQHEFSKSLLISEHKQEQVCPECGVYPAQQILAPVDFVLRGDGWTGKNIKVKGQMAAKNQVLSAKANERYGARKLIPNVGGEEVASWSEAQMVAGGQGKDPLSYEPMVQQETL